MSRIESINDFVIRFANVNGSGSASANNLFAKAVFRMGVPVSPKNIFPSNIQGLPTWYEVRINEKGYLGRRGGVDMMVAINGQTLVSDYLEVAPGGYFLYDSTRQLPERCDRDDVEVFGIPLTEMCNSTFSHPKLRQLLKNIIYIGALSHLVGLRLRGAYRLDHPPVQEQTQTRRTQSPGPGDWVELCQGALPGWLRHPAGAAGPPGRRHPDGRQQRRGPWGSLCRRHGTGWYPITPSTSVIEAFERFGNRFRVETEPV